MAQTRRRVNKRNDYTVHNKVKIVRGGASYFDAIEEIADNAKYSLHLQTYIFDENETGLRVADVHAYRWLRIPKALPGIYLPAQGCGCSF